MITAEQLFENENTRLDLTIITDDGIQVLKGWHVEPQAHSTGNAERFIIAWNPEHTELYHFNVDDVRQIRYYVAE